MIAHIRRKEKSMVDIFNECIKKHKASSKANKQINNKDLNESNKGKIYQKFYELYEKGEGSILFDYEILTKNGTKKFHESSVYLRYNFKGEIIGFRGLVRDISERKKVEVFLGCTGKGRYHWF